MIEMWPIPGFDGYFATKDGRIFSTRQRKAGSEPKELRPRIGHWGRRYLMLYSDGKGRTRKVHQLIILTFVGPRPSGMFACHGPNGPNDNSISNLYYAPPSQNNKEDRIRDGTVKRGENHPGAKLSESDVRYIRQHAGWGTGRKLARMFDVTPGAISCVRKNKSWNWLQKEK